MKKKKKMKMKMKKKKFEAKYRETQCPAPDARERLREQAGKRRKRKKRRKRRPRTSSRPSRQLWRRLPSSCTCLPTSGTTSVVSRVRRRVGLLVPGFLPPVSGLLASTAQRQFRIGCCFPPGLLGEGGHNYLDMSEHTCGMAFDATVPEVALDMQKTVEIPQLQFIYIVVVFPVVTHWLFF